MLSCDPATMCVTPYMKCFSSEHRLFSPLDLRVHVSDEWMNKIMLLFVVFCGVLPALPLQKPNAFIGKFHIYTRLFSWALQRSRDKGRAANRSLPNKRGKLSAPCLLVTQFVRLADRKQILFIKPLSPWHRCDSLAIQL